MNPYPILAGILLFVASLSGAYLKGKQDAKMDALVVQQAANKAAIDALVHIREELRPKVQNFYSETTKYPDCHATKEGHDALLGLYK
jgi:hypothetical protein